MVVSVKNSTLLLTILWHNRQTIKRKGSYDNGTINLEAAYDNADPGQILLRMASDSDNSYSIRVTMQDATTFYFTAQVFSFDISVGGETILPPSLVT